MTLIRMYYSTQKYFLGSNLLKKVDIQYSSNVKIIYISRKHSSQLVINAAYDDEIYKNEYLGIESLSFLNCKMQE